MSYGLNDVTIIIPTRNNLELLKLCVQSIFDNPLYKDIKIIIGDDNSTDGTSSFMQSIKSENLDYIHFTKEERHGLVYIVPMLIKSSRTDIILYIHADMVLGKDTIGNMLKHVKDKVIISGTRVEPEGMWAPEPIKHLKPFGMYPHEFNRSAFIDFEKEISVSMKDGTVPGFFAPHMFLKKDWIGYDPMFSPQSREDADLAYRYVQNGYTLITAKDAIVYHFAARGSRRKDDITKDSLEWQFSEGKNLKNFIRKWHTVPVAHQSVMPNIVPDIPISCHILAKNEGTLMYGFLNRIEPFFDDIVIIEDGSTDNTLTEIERYCNDTFNNGPSNFRLNKVRVFKRPLNGDFAGQTNFAVEKCLNEWTMKLDVDEIPDLEMLNNLRLVCKTCDENHKDVVGFRRINLLDGVVVNDLPRDRWTMDGLDEERKNQSGKDVSISNKDWQFRLHRKQVKWVNNVHEVPEPVKNMERDRVVLIDSFGLLHPKTLDKQMQQNATYDKILKPKEKVKNILFNSVLYTNEGITKHAKEEMIELYRRGYKLNMISLPQNKDFIKYHSVPFPIDDEYITYVNQPPLRPNNPQMSLSGMLGHKNIVHYLAFEGILPREWVEVMNHQNVKSIMTPSTYCREMFIKSGIRNPERIHIIPHGFRELNHKKYKAEMKERFKGKFVFLTAGTPHCNRKGMDLVIKAFAQNFGGNPDYVLIVKANRIYKPNQSVNAFIAKNAGDLYDNILYIDDEVSDEQMQGLIAGADCYVAASRCEGFNIILLEALCLGIPCIASKNSGHLDFCRMDNCLFVDTKREVYADYIYPYEDTKWFEPDIDKLRQAMIDVVNTPERMKEITEEAIKLKDEYSWTNIVDKMEEVFDKL